MNTEPAQAEYLEVIRDEYLADVMNFEKALARIVVRLLGQPGTSKVDEKAMSGDGGREDQTCEA